MAAHMRALLQTKGTAEHVPGSKAGLPLESIRIRYGKAVAQIRERSSAGLSKRALRIENEKN